MATRTKTPVDRAALLRRSLLELVAERGFRGTSMSAVADHAGVATGTAYVHYDSKDELVIAAYAEIKADEGHDAFLMPIPRYLDVFSAYMARVGRDT